MAVGFDFDSLLCTEDPREVIDFGGIDECTSFWDQENHQIDHQNPNNESQRLVGLPMRSEESLIEMFEKETEYLPRDDYLQRLRIGGLELDVRNDALDWFWKAHAHFDYGPLCVCVAVNYFNRALSIYDIRRDQSWILKLLPATCFILAAKVKGSKAPRYKDFPEGVPIYAIERITLQRMEISVLGALKWRMQAITPYSFIDCFLSKLSDDQPPLISSVSSSVQLILSTIKGIDFLEFRPSEIAAAVAITTVSGEIQALDIDNAIDSFIHVEKERVLKCLELLKVVIHRPDEMLDAACLGSKSDDDTTIGSCANSSHSNLDTKRRKLD